MDVCFALCESQSVSVVIRGSLHVRLRDSVSFSLVEVNSTAILVWDK